MKSDLPSAVVVIALGLVALVAAAKLPPTPGQNYGAGFVPGLVAGLMTAAGVLLALRALRRRASFASEPAAKLARPMGLLVVLGGLTGYVLLSERLGFHLIAMLVVGGATVAFTGRWRTAVPVAVGAAIGVHAVFYGLFKVPLPWGVLQPLAW